MTLEEASAEALDAVRAGDLDRLTTALAARSLALSRGESATPRVHAAGELTAQLLRDLIRETGLESARLRQLQRAFGSSESPTHINVVI